MKLHPREQHFLRMFSENELLEDILARDSEAFIAWNQDAKDYARQIKKRVNLTKKFIKEYNALNI